MSRFHTIVRRRLPSGDFSVSAPLEQIEVLSDSLQDAEHELMAVLGAKDMARDRLRRLARATDIQFDPGRGCYMADCALAGLSVGGATRAHAWDNLIMAVRLVGEALDDARSQSTQGQDETETTDNG